MTFAPPGSELDLGIRAVGERRRGVHVGLEVEDGDRVVELDDSEKTRGGDAGDDSDASDVPQRAHV